jgi:hypothetical protein
MGAQQPQNLNVIEARVVSLPWREEGEEHEEAAKEAHQQPQPPPVAAAVARDEEAKRRAALLANVKQDYRVDGGSFYFRERPDMLAFKDAGTKLVTSLNAPQVAFSMAAMAEAKGWKGITVSGHPDFRREVWLEARLRGISVMGYEPKERDKEELASRLERVMHNTVAQRDPNRLKQGEGTRETLAQAEALNAKSPVDTIRASKEVTDAAETLLEARDRMESNALPRVDEKRAIIKAVAAALAESKVQNAAVVQRVLASVDRRLDQQAAEGRLPSVLVYDKTAPARQQESLRPSVERSARTR